MGKLDIPTMIHCFSGVILIIIRPVEVQEVQEYVDFSSNIFSLFEGLVYSISAFQERVRRILKIGQINNVRHNPTMNGRILGNSCNKYLNFIADTGTQVAIIPWSLNERNKLQIVPTDPDEPEYKGVTGMKLTVVGQTEMFIKFKTMKTTKFLRACEDEDNEILVDLETFVEWSIIPKCFPLLMNTEDLVRNAKEADDIPKKIVDIKEHIGLWRTDIKFALLLL